MDGRSTEPDRAADRWPSAAAFSAGAVFGAVLVSGLGRSAGSEAFIVLPGGRQATGLLAFAVLTAAALALMEPSGPGVGPLSRMLRQARAGFYRRFRKGRTPAELRQAFAGAAIALVALCGAMLFGAATALGILRWLMPLAILVVLYVNLRICLFLCRLAHFDPVWCAILGLIYGGLVMSRFLG
jgi:hypothetical protein